jgi:hypothetical protein
MDFSPDKLRKRFAELSEQHDKLDAIAVLASVGLSSYGFTYDNWGANPSTDRAGNVGCSRRVERRRHVHADRIGREHLPRRLLDCDLGQRRVQHRLSRRIICSISASILPAGSAATPP